MIYLHLGVHKTATTYLQNLFAHNQGRIAIGGRAYWRLDELRPVLANGLAEARTRRNERFGFVRQLLCNHAPPFRRLEEMLAIPMDTILSEENILGHPFQALHGKFYIRARENLGLIKPALDDREIEIWLSVRNYATFLCSLYAEALRHAYAKPIEHFVEMTRSPDGQWPALVETVHECFPDARIVVWAYENFSELRPRIVGRLSGVPFSDLAPLPTDDVRPSPSGQAVELQSERAGSLRTSLERKLSMAMLEDEYPLNRFPRKFNPWNEDDMERMQSAYARDLKWVGSFDYVEFLNVHGQGHQEK
jgi:hypothetical protein